MIKNNLCTNVQLCAEKVMKTFSAHESVKFSVSMEKILL